METSLKERVLLLFYDLLKTSALIQGTMALGATATMAYLYVKGIAVPPTMTDIVMVIVGYYFGSKTQSRNTQEVIKNVTERLNRIDAGTDTTDRNST